MNGALVLPYDPRANRSHERNDEKKRDGSKKTSKGLEGFGDLLFTDGTRR